jgi:hypothetical protein
MINPLHLGSPSSNLLRALLLNDVISSLAESLKGKVLSQQFKAGKQLLHGKALGLLLFLGGGGVSTWSILIREWGSIIMSEELEMLR